MKKCTVIYTITILCVAILLVVTAVIYHNGFTIALKKTGFSNPEVITVETGINDNGDEYRIVFQYLSDNKVQIAHLTQSSMGRWRATEVVCGPSSEFGLISMKWMRVASISRFHIGGSSTVEFEVHSVYAGNNAIKQIEIPLDQLPPNVSVNIYQAGTAFVLHFVAFGDAEILNQIDVASLLIETNSVSR